MFAKASKLQVTSYMLWHNIDIYEKSIAKLLNHDGFGKRCFDMPAKKVKMDEIAEVIF